MLSEYSIRAEKEKASGEDAGNGRAGHTTLESACAGGFWDEGEPDKNGTGRRKTA